MHRCKHSFHVVFALIIVLAVLGQSAKATPRPNILWLSAEDISPHFGCYGDPHAITPNIDRLAGEGVRYTNAFTTAGVCAPCRSGIITGMYQTTLGTHHMRCQAPLPKGVRLLPELLRDHGYFATNNSKEDYQFATPKTAWDRSSPSAHWRDRPNKDQPFFAVFNFTGCHESGITRASKYRKVTEALSPAERQDAAALTTLPPYYPDTPLVREDWKRNYELITAMDAWAGDLLRQLEDDGIADDTVVMFWSDHGVGLPRAKRWLYDSGVHIPLVIRIPPKYRAADQPTAGAVLDRLVSSIDLAPTVLRLAGVDVPGNMQGRPFLEDGEPREYVYGARDRMDERYDVIRMARDNRFKYLRNYEPLKTYYQYMNTPELGATMKELRRLHNAGGLPPAAERYFAAVKPTEELYDVAADPHEVNNLAKDQRYAEVLDRFRRALREWSNRTGDLGLVPEPILVELLANGVRPPDVFRGSDGQLLVRRLTTTATRASSKDEPVGSLEAACDDPHPAVRYWALTGIGNRDAFAASSLKTAKRLLTDESTTVRIAAARALCRGGRLDDGLPVLTSALSDGRQWERLYAANVLDELDDQARSAIPALRAALRPRKGLYAGGKYTVRAANRAINELLGTDSVVP